MKWGQLSSSLGEFSFWPPFSAACGLNLSPEAEVCFGGGGSSWKPRHGSSIFLQALVWAEVLACSELFCGPYFLCTPKGGSQNSGMAKKFAFRASLID